MAEIKRLFAKIGRGDTFLPRCLVAERRKSRSARGRLASHEKIGEPPRNRTLDWDFDTIYDFIHAKHVLVANNNHQPIRPKEDIQLFERDLPGEGAMFSKNQPLAHDRPVEQCDVIQKGIWGYRINEHTFRTAEEVCAMICRCAAKDANLLMNIGPDGSGRLPDRAIAVMAEVGKWMRANGEAIYATRGLGLVKNADGSETGKTRKGERIYTITIVKGAFPTVERSGNASSTIPSATASP